MTETRSDGGAGVRPHAPRRAWRPALAGLLVIAVVWAVWWVAATVADGTGREEAAYVIVFLGGAVAILVTLVTLVVAAVSTAAALLRRS